MKILLTLCCASLFICSLTFAASHSLPAATQGASQAVESRQAGSPIKVPGKDAPSAGWPEAVNDTLPLAGIFYGNFKAGLSSGNGPLAAQNAIRFRAERTGLVDAVRYFNRRILPTDIDARCKLYGPGSVWCNCKDNELDNWSCGYTLSNAYHVGSGGLITIELREDDGSDEHLPGTVVLAETEPYQPALVPEKFPTFSLKKPVQLQAGRIYHIVFRNDKPPSCTVRMLSLQAAADCPREEGAISLNGTKHASDESDGSRFGPYLGRINGRILYRPSAEFPWRISPDVIAFFELRYTDGEYVGNSYTGYLNSSYAEAKGGSRVIEGDVIARQAFTVDDATRKVDGLWLNYGHAYDRPANGKTLLITLRSNNGDVISTSSLPASMACSARAINGAAGKAKREKRDEWMCRRWAHAAFPQPVSLRKGASYVVDFSAPKGAAFALSTYFTIHHFPERNIWDNAQAKISRDAGTSWELWTGKYFGSRDLPVMFSIEGMPRQLP